MQSTAVLLALEKKTMVLYGYSILVAVVPETQIRTKDHSPDLTSQLTPVMVATRQGFLCDREAIIYRPGWKWAAKVQCPPISAISIGTKDPEPVPSM